MILPRFLPLLQTPTTLSLYLPLFQLWLKRSTAIRVSPRSHRDPIQNSQSLVSFSSAYSAPSLSRQFEADLAPSLSTSFTSTRSRFVEDFFSSALDDEDQLQRMHSLHQQQQQQHLLNLHLHRPTSPSLSALSFRSELVPLDRSINGDGTEIEPSVIEEMYEEEGGRIERLGGKVHL